MGDEYTFAGFSRNTLMAMVIVFLGGGATGSMGTQALNTSSDDIRQNHIKSIANSERLSITEQRISSIEELQRRIDAQLRVSDEKLNRIIGALQKDKDL